MHTHHAARLTCSYHVPYVFIYHIFMVYIHIPHIPYIYTTSTTVHMHTLGTCHTALLIYTYTTPTTVHMHTQGTCHAALLICLHHILIYHICTIPYI